MPEPHLRPNLPGDDHLTRSPDPAIQRGRDRYRRIALSALGSASSTAISFIVTLVITPLTLSYLGTARFGMWITLASAVVIFQLADIGIGNALLNAAARSSASASTEGRVAQEVSAGLAVTVVVGIGLSAAALAIYPHVEWASVLNVTAEPARSEAGPAVLTFALISFLAMPVNLVAKTQSAFQEGYIPELWKILGSLLRLGGVVICVVLRTNVAWLVFATLMGPIVASVANGIHLFAVRRPALRPSFRLVDLTTVQTLVGMGGLFFVLQAAVALGYSTDNFVIARVLGAEAVPNYSVPATLFAVINTGMSFVLTPLWPAYREALQNQDFQWVGATLRTSVKWSLALTVPLSASLVVAAPYLVKAWVGDAVSVTDSTLLGLAAWTVIGTAGNGFAMFLNAVGAVRILTISASLMAISNIIVSVILTQRIGVAGAIWGTVVSFSAVTGTMVLVVMPRLLRRLRAGTLRIR